MLIGNRHGIQDLCIDALIFKINYIHLFTNALQRCLSAQGCQISTNVTVEIME